MTFRVAPSPNDGSFSLYADGLEGGLTLVEITDPAGRILDQCSLPIAGGELRGTFFLELSAGMYMVRLSDDRASHIARFVVR